MKARNRVQLVFGIILGAVISVSAFAQYSTGTMGGSGSSTSGAYTAPKSGYSSSTGIAVGAAAAVGGALLAYFLLRNRGSMEGCVQKSGHGVELMNEKNKKAYALEAGGLTLKPGELVKLRGKKTKTNSGESAFTANKLVKDYGSCTGQAALMQPAKP